MASDARPAQPKSILRGHKAQVHAAAFVRGNERLVTGDADGFVIAWDLAIMRPRAVWQAHENAILGIASWGHDRLITHGRDNKLIVWKFTEEDEARLSTRLPLDPSPETQPQPWILYLLEVNTMNFCSFSHSPALPGSGSESNEILIAVPNTLASEAVDIFHLPSQTRQHTVKLGSKNGMVMALALFHQGSTLTLVAGYENGLALVAQLGVHGNWTVKYQAQPHSQPILSLATSPQKDFFLTSSADAIIAKHPLPLPPPSPSQQPATPPPTLPQPSPSAEADPSKSLLSAALAATTTPSSTSPQAPPSVSTTAPATATSTTAKATPHIEIKTTPLKVLNTRHAGQQSLSIRSDSRVFATAGWDARVRVYSTRTMAEVAVLKWHGVGCYAIAFADVAVNQDRDRSGDVVGEGGGAGASDGSRREGGVKEEKGERGSVIKVPRLVEMSVREKRMQQVRTAHWLAAGSKDGKVSLWDVF